MRLGVVLVLVGLAIAAVGGLLLVAPRAFGWFGHLPGDLRFESARGRVFVPITSMIVVSVVLTLLANGVAWLLRRL